MDNHGLTNKMYSPQQHSSNAHHHNNVSSYINDGCYRQRNSPGQLHKRCYERNQRTAQSPTSHTPQKWCRNNIALTMEYFEPISKTSTPKRYSNQSDYSYAYYEPGMAMRHSNIPKMPTTDYLNAPPSTSTSTTSAHSSPKSIRSLLTKPNHDDRTLANNRHTYTTRYGTQENIYEDVSSIRMHPDGNNESMSEAPVKGRAHRGSKIEFQDILHSHYRVLEELNLSVEEMFLTSTKKTTAPFTKKLSKRSSKFRSKTKNDSGSKNVSASSTNVTEDSGFSGSSSGASYIGSLRKFKTVLTRSKSKPTEINKPTNNVNDCGTSVTEVQIPNDSKQKVFLQISNQLKGDKCSASRTLKGLKFWSKN